MSTEMMSVPKIVDMVTTAINALALIFNLFGIYLLETSGLRNSFQIQIITNLSACDILISIGNLVSMVLQFNGHKLTTSRMVQGIWALREAVYHTWIIMFYLLTLNRFLGCNFPFKYRALASPMKGKIILAVSWGIAIILGPTFVVVDTLTVRVYTNKYLWLVYDGIFLFLFFVTYATVFYRKKRSNKNLRRRSSGQGNQRFFKLTVTMLAAFLLFEIVPTIGSAVLAMINLKIRDVFQYIFELCWSLNLLVDPLIYIYVMPRVRHTAIIKLQSLFCMCRESRVAVPERSSKEESDQPTVAHITKDEES